MTINVYWFVGILYSFKKGENWEEKWKPIIIFRSGTRLASDMKLRL